MRVRGRLRAVSWASAVAAMTVLTATLAGASDPTADQAVTIRVVGPRTLSINNVAVTLDPITYGVDYSPPGVATQTNATTRLPEGGIGGTVLTFSVGLEKEATLIAELTSLERVTGGEKADVRWQDVFLPNPSPATPRNGVDFEIGLTSNNSCTPVITQRCSSVASGNFRPSISAATTPESSVTEAVPLRASMTQTGGAQPLVAGGAGTAPANQPLQKGVSGTASISFSYRGRPMPPSGGLPDSIEIGLRYLIVDSGEG